MLALRRVAAERSIVEHIDVGLVVAQLLRHQVRHLVENITTVRRLVIRSVQAVCSCEFILQKHLLLQLLLVDACQLARYQVVQHRSVRLLDATRLVVFK